MVETLGCRLRYSLHFAVCARRRKIRETVELFIATEKKYLIFVVTLKLLVIQFVRSVRIEDRNHYTDTEQGIHMRLDMNVRMCSRLATWNEY